MQKYEDLDLDTRNALFRFACGMARSILRDNGWYRHKIHWVRSAEHTLALRLLNEQMEHVFSLWISTGEYAKDL